MASKEQVAQMMQEFELLRTRLGEAEAQNAQLHQELVAVQQAAQAQAPPAPPPAALKPADPSRFAKPSKRGLEGVHLEEHRCGLEPPYTGAC